MKQLYIIRHAESIANAGKRTDRHDTVPLSEKGREQAEFLAQTLEVIPDLVVVSPFTRTQETASPYLSRYPHVPVEVWDVQEFTYLDTKLYSGTTAEERLDAVRKFWERLQIHHQDGPGSETFYMLIERIRNFLLKVESRPEETIVVFSHGGFIQNLKTYLDVVKGGYCSPPSEEVVLTLMLRYKDLVGLKFPIENASVHKLSL